VSTIPQFVPAAGTAAPPTGPAAGESVSAAEQRDIAAAEALLNARAMPSIILEGEMGTGKTHSARSLLVDANGKFDGPSVSGIEKVVLLTSEAGFEDVLGDIPQHKLAWKYIPASDGSFDGLVEMARVINTQHPDVIQKNGGINRHMYPQFQNILGACNNIIDDRTGAHLGPVFKFPQNWCLWYESISILSELARNCAIGDKPFMELRDYQMVQTMVRKFLNHLVFSTRCLFVATAHLERETNESNGMSELMVSTVGRKLAPILPRFFSDVIITGRIDQPGNPKFTWATQVPGARTKTRNLPWSPELPPDFRPLLNNFRERQARAVAADKLRKDANA